MLEFWIALLIALRIGLKTLYCHPKYAGVLEWRTPWREHSNPADGQSCAKRQCSTVSRFCKINRNRKFTNRQRVVSRNATHFCRACRWLNGMRENHAQDAPHPQATSERGSIRLINHSHNYASDTSLSGDRKSSRCGHQVGALPVFCLLRPSSRVI